MQPGDCVRCILGMGVTNRFCGEANQITNQKLQTESRINLCSLVNKLTKHFLELFFKKLAANFKSFNYV
jgi:hypothetical protein